MLTLRMFVVAERISSTITTAAAMSTTTSTITLDEFVSPIVTKTECICGGYYRLALMLKSRSECPEGKRQGVEFVG